MSINYDDKDDRIFHTLKWMGKAVRKMTAPEMIVVWDKESTDVIPDPYRFEYLKTEAESLMTVN